MSQKYLPEEEMDLFDGILLENVITSPENHLMIRPLRSTDYNKGFLQLLGQLTEVGHFDKEQFLSRFDKMKNSGDYYVIVIEDVHINKVIGTTTLIAEQKFIHNCALRGRLEDVVVDDNYRGKHLGKTLVIVAKQLAQHLKCYKMSLECKNDLVPFYQELGFQKELDNSNYLNIRFHNEKTSKHPSQFHL